MYLCITSLYRLMLTPCGYVKSMEREHFFQIQAQTPLNLFSHRILAVSSLALLSKALQVAHNHPASTVPVATPLQIPPHSGPSTSGTSFRPLQMKKSFSVKVTKADVSVQANGKIELSKVKQMFIDVTDDTSNVHYINSIVREKWGPGHITVTNDGLPVEDSSGTQGLSTSFPCIK